MIFQMMQGVFEQRSLVSPQSAACLSQIIVIFAIHYLLLYPSRLVLWLGGCPQILCEYGDGYGMQYVWFHMAEAVRLRN